jgi:hypothetical protein
MVAPRLNDPLTADQLRSMLDYDPATGIFTWLLRKHAPKHWNTRWSGKAAGSVTFSGYLHIRLGNRIYRAHRLVFLWMVGAWPENEVDHQDGNRLNNRWSNLRQATPSENRMNKGMRSDNTSGRKGVCLDRRSKRWQAQVMLSKKRHHLGYFDTPEEAHAAYVEAARRLHGKFARTS